MERFKLVPITVLPNVYQQLFKEFCLFNRIQSELYPTIFDSDDSIVVAAPTASGKTVIFELAIIKLLIDLEGDLRARSNVKIIYVSPMKALCEERFNDWSKRLSCLENLTIGIVTGDSNNMQINDLNFNIIITTPEKWDSLTRQWRNHPQFMDSISLFLIDEVHLINDKHRGPTLEAIVSRMKFIRDQKRGKDLRFIAVSATIPNVEELSEWLSADNRPCKAVFYSDKMRPVPLTKIVKGYNFDNQINHFQFDMKLNSKLFEVIMQYSSGRPTLIFCSTRVSVEMAAKALTESIKTKLIKSQKEILRNAAQQVGSPILGELLLYGIGIHHGGVYSSDRRIVENLFRDSKLPVLLTTSTLSMGVNLPAHLVIIKNTKQYIDRQYVDYPSSAIMQMLGRAGRPQYDKEAKAVIMTTWIDKCKYENIVTSVEPLKSYMLYEIAEHLHSEISLGTITSLISAFKWLQSTFLYIRAKKYPKDCLPPSCNNLEKWLTNTLREKIDQLLADNLIVKCGETESIKASPAGKLMAKYNMSFDSMKMLATVSTHANISSVLSAICNLKEFNTIYLRKNEKAILNKLNDKPSKLRFPIQSKINTIALKVNCLIQAYLGCIPITDPSLLIDTEKVIRLSEKICKCLYEYLSLKPNSNNFRALLSSFVLFKSIKAEIWDNSNYVGRQLPGIDMHKAQCLVKEGKTSFQAILESNPIKLNHLCQINVGEEITTVIRGLPKYRMQIKECKVDSQSSSVTITIDMLNQHDLLSNLSLHPASCMAIIVGEEYSNNLLLHAKLSHDYMIDNGSWATTLNPTYTCNQNVMIRSHLISDHWVGFDCVERLELFPKSNSEVPERKSNVKRRKTESNKLYKQKTLTSLLKKLEKKTPSINNPSQNRNKLKFTIDDIIENKIIRKVHNNSVAPIIEILSNSDDNSPTDSKELNNFINALDCDSPTKTDTLQALQGLNPTENEITPDSQSQGNQVASRPNLTVCSDFKTSENAQKEQELNQNQLLIPVLEKPTTIPSTFLKFVETKRATTPALVNKVNLCTIATSENKPSCSTIQNNSGPFGQTGFKMHTPEENGWKNQAKHMFSNVLRAPTAKTRCGTIPRTFGQIDAQVPSCSNTNIRNGYKDQTEHKSTNGFYSTSAQPSRGTISRTSQQKDMQTPPCFDSKQVPQILHTKNAPEMDLNASLAMASVANNQKHDFSNETQSTNMISDTHTLVSKDCYYSFDETLTIKKSNNSIHPPRYRPAFASKRFTSHIKLDYKETHKGMQFEQQSPPCGFKRFALERKRLKKFGWDPSQGDKIGKGTNNFEVNDFSEEPLTPNTKSNDGSFYYSADLDRTYLSGDNPLLEVEVGSVETPPELHTVYSESEGSEAQVQVIKVKAVRFDNYCSVINQSDSD